MHRTQLSLEEWQYEALLALSQREGRSLSNLVREILSQHLRRTRKSARAKLLELEGIGANPEATGRDHDRILYGSDRGVT